MTSGRGEDAATREVIARVLQGQASRGTGPRVAEAAEAVEVAEAAPANLSPRMRAFVLAVDRGVLWLARHWLLAVNLIGGLYAGLPLLGPWLLARGYTAPARVIYFLYGLTCHQRADRSFFVFGQKMCYCERCTAIYGGVFALGLFYAFAKGRVDPLRWKWMFLLWAPMALDGFTQLFGLRESTWELRVVTGSLFALSLVWVGFPYLERGFAEIREQLEQRFARVAAQRAWSVERGA